MKKGITFVVRCRNEEDTLEKSLMSLSELKIPYEINIFLHLCTDRSREIAERLKSHLNINIFEYDKEVSRAGYETYITPEEHENSFVVYSRYCFSKSNFDWIFRWDSDFFATPELIDFLNKIDFNSNQKIRYKIPCRLGDNGPINGEIYLSNCFAGVKKYMFWELYLHYSDSIEIDLTPVCRIDSVGINKVKEYWKNTPWFFGKDKTLQDAYVDLVSKWGEEPVGMARASNPECDKYINLALNNK